MYIYKLLDKNENLLYIGKTKDINIRTRQHILGARKIEWKSNIEKIMYADCHNETDMNIYEVYYINKLSPMYNRSENYNKEPSIILPDLTFKEYIDKETHMKLKNISDAELGKLFRIYLSFENEAFSMSDALKILQFKNNRSVDNYLCKMIKIGYIIKLENKKYRVKL